MDINRKSRLQFRIQNLLFLVLFLTMIGLLAWLSQRYSTESDWTATRRNTLSDASIKLLQKMPEPVNIISFARESNLVPTRRNVQEIIGRYQKHKTDITLTFINPDTEPDKTRSMGITVDGELVITYRDRAEHVTSISEETVTNTLQRLLRSGEKKLVFLEGHGERQPTGQANHDYHRFIQHLDDKGIKATTLNLTERHAIPDDTAVLIIAGPQLNYLAGEVELIRKYIDQGGNLLWLHDPGSLYNLDKLASDLEIRFIKGVVVDPSTQLLGIEDPSFALVTRYGEHAITSNFSLMTIFPRATAIEFTGQDSADSKNQWTASPILLTVERSWSETDKLEGVIEYSENSDTLGPLSIGMALHRNTPGAASENQDADGNTVLPTQRIIVMGDGDFLSNTYLGNQGNQDLGYNMINWLSHDDTFISIPVAIAPDSELVFNEKAWSFLGLFLLFGIPLLLLGNGIFIWLKRRKQ